jgi:hypothetical protein
MSLYSKLSNNEPFFTSAAASLFLLTLFACVCLIKAVAATPGEKHSKGQTSGCLKQQNINIFLKVVVLVYYMT